MYAVTSNNYAPIDGKVLTTDSVDLLTVGALNGVDVMIGTVADERTALDGAPDKVMEIEKAASLLLAILSLGEHQARVAAGAPQPHDLRQDLQVLRTFPLDLAAAGERFQGASPERLVERRLLLSHFHLDGDLGARGELFEYLVLGAAQDEGLDQLLEPAARLLVLPLLNGGDELNVELLQGAEQPGLMKRKTFQSSPGGSRSGCRSPPS